MKSTTPKMFTGKTRNFVSNEIICKFCAAAHYINQCNKYLALTPQKRFEEVRSRNLCINCLKANQTSKTCGSLTCKTCRKKHHTLLHFPQANDKPTVTDISKVNDRQTCSCPRITSISDNINSIQNEEPSSSRVTSNNFNKTNNVLLSTAVIQVKDNEGRYNQCRALLDNGSQSHFMTEELSKTLEVHIKHITHKTNMSVVSTILSTRLLYHDIDFILRNGGFLLNKWVSNHPALISHITSDKPESIIYIETDEETHSLGLLWLSKQDYLTFQINFELVDKPSTKRSVLSTITRVFDPPGILAPIVVKAKIILQNIWKLHLGWDESLPLSLHMEWQNIYNSLARINDNFTDSLMHEKGLLEPVYIFVQSTKTVRCMLTYFCAKSRVAPVKPVTIPCLEVCAALLVAQLYDKVISSWNGNIDAVYLWSDSTLEARKISAVIACFHLADELRIFERCSSFSKLCRVIAFMIRFKCNCTNKQNFTGHLTQSQSFRSEILNIKTKKPIGKGKLLKFNPYLGKDDILLVGGRLNDSDLPFEQKHPIILDSKHPFTHLMVSSEHNRLLYAGPQLLLANIREKYWILGWRNLLIQKLMQTIWSRWSKEYISELQVRSKWRQNYPNFLNQGAVVLLKEDNLPPLKWSLGRTLELHPGKDGVTRVVSVKTSGGVLKRPVMEVCVPVGAILQSNNIIYASTISNNRICIYLRTAKLVDELTKNHKTIKIKYHEIEIRKLVTPTQRLVVSNVCRSIPNNLIENMLKDHGLKLLSRITHLRVGMPGAEYSHILSFHRLVYIAATDINIPETTTIAIEATTTEYLCPLKNVDAQIATAVT
nr:unnamed protein product [Callosobruchus analis]